MVATFEEWINSNLYQGRLNADRAVLRNYKDAYSQGKSGVKDSSEDDHWRGFFSYYSNSFLARFAVGRAFSSKNDFVVCEKGAHRAIIDGINSSFCQVAYFDRGNIEFIKKSLEDFRS